MLPSIRRFFTVGLPVKSSPTPQVLLYPAGEGDVLNNRYSIKRRLGADFGTRSTTWLIKDLITGHDIILKITGADSTDAGKYSHLASSLAFRRIVSLSFHIVSLWECENVVLTCIKNGCTSFQQAKMNMLSSFCFLC
ncbi:uncharacterized protein BT62DRAFT_998477 [Guyanagaster necrorhizus]|uniref:Uncharacterized protein n=1 Tax=Guyanagaster necrorhizus TaxID=856835 RepID=A0A9P7W4S0_9AGAR|nr:uncharacterized protein BT62DRAFT_998477 [Guyanagaster necrorhizus MCA 3950]KAG7452440.1 hypothetical protein BT62DRAFT_998477 [Guyanagaster necrorhizus MCA 3950]